MSQSHTTIANLVPTTILRSPLHGLLSGKRSVLGFTGRRSGTRYATPVNYLQRGDELVITTDSAWWHNFDGGAGVEIRLRGRSVTGRGEVIHDDEQAARALGDLIRDHPPYRRWAHVGLDGGGEPMLQDLHSAIRDGRKAIRIVLDGGARS